MTKKTYKWARKEHLELARMHRNDPDQRRHYIQILAAIRQSYYKRRPKEETR